MAERYKVELGQAIARRRRELGMTQKDLADATHYKEPQSVSRWERGQNLPGDLDAIAQALNCTLPELVAGIQPPDGKAARRLGLVPPMPEGTPEPFAVPDRLSAIERRIAENTDRLAAIEGQLQQILAAAGVEPDGAGDLADRIVKTVERAINRRAPAVARPPQRPAAASGP